MSEEHIFRVAFREPPIEGDSRTEFFFHSLSAIYEVFTAEQVGCKVSRLWNIGVSNGTTYEGRLCTISREPISRKKRIKAPQPPQADGNNNLHDCEK